MEDRKRGLGEELEGISKQQVWELRKKNETKKKGQES